MTAVEWWGPSATDVEHGWALGPGGSLGKVPSRRIGVLQRDGTTVRTEVTLSESEYYERLERPRRRQRKRAAEPVWEPATQVHEFIAWLVAADIAPSMTLRLEYRQPGGMSYEQARDLLTAQEIRSLRDPAKHSDSDGGCISEGCDEPVKYHTPAPSCRKCWRYHDDKRSWPPLMSSLTDEHVRASHPRYRVNSNLDTVIEIALSLEREATLAKAGLQYRRETPDGEMLLPIGTSAHVSAIAALLTKLRGLPI